MTTSTGPEKWVPEAIAEQEEYLKRMRSCGDVLGSAHRWDTFSAAPGASYEACWRCRVTKTPADYATKMRANA